MKLSIRAHVLPLKKEYPVLIFMTQETIVSTINSLPHDISEFLRDIDLKFFKARASETAFIPAPLSSSVILCGLGEDENITPETLRNAASSACMMCREKSLTDIAVMPPHLKKIEDSVVLTALAEGIYLTNYCFDKYKSYTDDPVKILLKNTFFITLLAQAPEILKEVEVVSRNTLLCRDLVNETSEKSNPVLISSMAKKIASLKNVSCTIYGKRQIESMKMGLFLAVNRGSKIPPQLVVLKYTGNQSSKKYTALVGKGITFDSGGVNLKPSGHIETMRMDMAGAAAVMYTLKAAAELKLKVNIYAVMPLTENMISNDAYRPGDVFQSYTGKTVEIGNTDAEGRLILADTLAFTVKVLKPQYVIDLATLTGACVTTFGETLAAILSNDEYLKKTLIEASQNSGERIWELPLYPDFDENLKSDIADLSNISSEKNAGTIMAAVFLKNFIDKVKWAHIDIAGTAWYSKQRAYRPKNATGFGPRLLIEALKLLE